MPSPRQASALTGAPAGRLTRHFGGVGEPHQHHHAVAVAGRKQFLRRMAGDGRHARILRTRREHRTAPCPSARRASENGHKITSCAPDVASHFSSAVKLMRAHARGIAGHPHVLAVGKPPAVQRRLLHRGDQKTPIGREQRAEMRALPGERLGLRIRVRKPERRAVVMRDREPQALRREGKPAHGRGHFKLSLALVGADEGGLSDRPRDRARRPERDLIDPLSAGIGERFPLAFDVGGDELAVIARGENPLSVAGRGEDRALDAL